MQVENDYCLLLLLIQYIFLYKSIYYTYIGTAGIATMKSTSHTRRASASSILKDNNKHENLTTMINNDNIIR